MSSDQIQRKTAFVFAGGGSFGAIQVGMLHALAAHGIAADVVFGSSVGALNGAYYAGMPTIEGIQQLEKIWRGLRRQDVFQVTWRSVFGFVRRRDFLVTSEGLRQLIDKHLPYRNLEEAKIPVAHRCDRCSVRRNRGAVERPGRAGHPCKRGDSAGVRTGEIRRFVPCRWRNLQQYAGQGCRCARRGTSHHLADRICLRARTAAKGRGGKRAARADVADRAAIAQRAGKPRSPHRLFYRAAAMSADGVAL